jgi:carboxypeptidase D
MRLSALSWALLGAPSLVFAMPSGSRDKRYTEEKAGTTYTVFEHAATEARLSFVINSGICETTPGVNQYSGYLTVGESTYMSAMVLILTRRIRREHEHVVLVLRS